MDARKLADSLGRVASVFQNAAIALYKGDAAEFERLYAFGLGQLDNFQDEKSANSE